MFFSTYLKIKSLSFDASETEGEENEGEASSGVDKTWGRPWPTL